MTISGKFRKAMFLILVVGAVNFSCTAAIPFIGPTLSLVSSLTGLGISSNQALGGLGAMLTFAKGELNPADFRTLTNAIPYSSTIMNGAQELGIPKAISTYTGLVSTFKSLEMNEQIMLNMVPIVSDFAEKKGGRDVVDIINNVFLKEREIK